MPNNKVEFQALLRRLAAPAQSPRWPDAPALEPGTHVPTGHQVGRLVARGGMGEVYAGQAPDGSPVAIKCLLRALAADARAVQRFTQEAALVAALAHPRIVRQLGAGVLPDGRPFLVLEWLAHGTLAERLAAAGRLPLAQVLTLARDVGEALAFAHAHDVLHRDVKPANVFVVQDGYKLADFGVAKLRAAQAGVLTTTGSAVGTPHFMAPEQLRGEAALDPRADVYALGVLLYHALSGALPFGARGFAALAVQVCTEEPTPLEACAPEVPAPLVRVIMRALAREPGQRHPEMGVFLGELAEASAQALV